MIGPKTLSMAKDYRSGMTLHQVGAKHGVSQETVRRRLKSIDVEMRPRGLQRDAPPLRPRTDYHREYQRRRRAKMRLEFDKPHADA